jgi:F0F1-type ATP synthase beta subunit
MSTIPEKPYNLIEMLGLQQLSEAKRLAIVDKAEELVEKRMAVRITERLDAASYEAFSKLEGKEQADYLASRMPDFNKVLQEEIDKVREELVSSTRPE